MAPKNLAILVHDDVEVLDFCGPFEAVGVTGDEGQAHFGRVHDGPLGARGRGARTEALIAS